ncbi:MAG: hypothetical protein NC548_65590 [Lachnospiraceae bacterium]|nr:hypothetical protein [Lachnospiraceae bacterium]
MAKENNPIDEGIAWMLREYERVTEQTSSQAAANFPISNSNYYRQRGGKGNARSKTQDSIFQVIGRTHPEIIAEGIKMIQENYVLNEEEKAEEEIQLLSELLV